MVCKCSLARKMVTNCKFLYDIIYLHSMHNWEGCESGVDAWPSCIFADNSILIKALIANLCHFPNSPAITRTHKLQLMPLLERYYSFPHVNGRRVESAKDNLLQNKTRELPIQVQSGKWLRSLLPCLIWVTLTLWGKLNWQTATNLFVFIGQYISVTNFELRNHIRMLKISQCFLSRKEQAAWCSELTPDFNLFQCLFLSILN